MTTYDITDISDAYRIEYRCDNGTTVHTVEFLSQDFNLIEGLAEARLAEAVVGIRFKTYPVVTGQIAQFYGPPGGPYTIEVRGKIFDGQSPQDDKQK